MKLGVFDEHPLPRPRGADGGLRLVGQALERIDLAGPRGVDRGSSRAGFLRDCSFALAPEIALARTDRTRGGVVTMAWRDSVATAPKVL